MKERFAQIGGIIASILAAACCIGPVVLAALGIAGFGLFSERLWPFFIALSFISMGLAYRYAYGKRAGCCREECDLRARRINRVLFWALVGFAVFGAVSPYIAEFLQ